MCTRAAGTLMGPAAHQDLQQGLTDASTLVGSSWHRGPTTGPAFEEPFSQWVCNLGEGFISPSGTLGKVRCPHLSYSPSAKNKQSWSLEYINADGSVLSWQLPMGEERVPRGTRS